MDPVQFAQLLDCAINSTDRDARIAASQSYVELIKSSPLLYVQNCMELIGGENDSLSQVSALLLFKNMNYEFNNSAIIRINDQNYALQCLGALLQILQSRERSNHILAECIAQMTHLLICNGVRCNTTFDYVVRALRGDDARQTALASIIFGNLSQLACKYQKVYMAYFKEIVQSLLNITNNNQVVYQATKAVCNIISQINYCYDESELIFDEQEQIAVFERLLGNIGRMDDDGYLIKSLGEVNDLLDMADKVVNDHQEVLLQLSTQLLLTQDGARRGTGLFESGLSIFSSLVDGGDEREFDEGRLGEIFGLVLGSLDRLVTADYKLAVVDRPDFMDAHDNNAIQSQIVYCMFRCFGSQYGGYFGQVAARQMREGGLSEYSQCIVLSMMLLNDGRIGDGEIMAMLQSLIGYCGSSDVNTRLWAMITLCNFYDNEVGSDKLKYLLSQWLVGDGIVQNMVKADQRLVVQSAIGVLSSLVKYCTSIHCISPVKEVSELVIEIISSLFCGMDAYMQLYTAQLMGHSINYSAIAQDSRVAKQVSSIGEFLAEVAAQIIQNQHATLTKVQSDYLVTLIEIFYRYGGNFERKITMGRQLLCIDALDHNIQNQLLVGLTAELEQCGQDELRGIVLATLPQIRRILQIEMLEYDSTSDITQSGAKDNTYIIKQHRLIFNFLSKIFSTAARKQYHLDLSTKDVLELFGKIEGSKYSSYDFSYVYGVYVSALSYLALEGWNDAFTDLFTQFGMVAAERLMSDNQKSLEECQFYISASSYFGELISLISGNPQLCQQFGEMFQDIVNHVVSCARRALEEMMKSYCSEESQDTSESHGTSSRMERDLSAFHEFCDSVAQLTRTCIERGHMIDQLTNILRQHIPSPPAAAILKEFLRSNVRGAVTVAEQVYVRFYDCYLAGRDNWIAQLLCQYYKHGGSATVSKDTQLADLAEGMDNGYRYCAALQYMFHYEFSEQGLTGCLKWLEANGVGYLHNREEIIMCLIDGAGHFEQETGSVFLTAIQQAVLAIYEAGDGLEGVKPAVEKFLCRQ